MFSSKINGKQMLRYVILYDNFSAIFSKSGTYLACFMAIFTTILQFIFLPTVYFLKYSCDINHVITLTGESKRSRDFSSQHFTF